MRGPPEEFPMAYRLEQRLDQKINQGINQRTKILLPQPSMPDQFVYEVIRKFSETAWEGSLCRNQSATNPGKSVTLSTRVPRAAHASYLPRRLFDFVCAAAGLALLAPLFAMIAAAIKLDDGGTV